MVNRADDNDEIYPKVPKVFQKARKVHNKKTGKPFKTGDNVKGRGFTVEEYVRLHPVAPEYLQDLLTVAVNLGLRSTEYFKLRWKHIDLEKGLIEIPAGLDKNAPARDIPINHNVREVIENLPKGKPEAPIFRGRDGRPLVQAPKKALKTACSFGWYCLRGRCDIF
jgi:integrase